MLKANLKSARKQAGMTQKEVASRLGITESTYCGYETGKREPDAARIGQIAQILGVTGNFLLDLPEREERPALTPDERRLLSLFRALDDRGRAAVIATAEALAVACV